MSITERAEQTASAVVSILQASPSKPQMRELVKLIEQALINAVLSEGERCTHVVMECCSADLDTAHKVAEQIRRSHQALVANLSSMR